MTDLAEDKNYNSIARLLHWVIAALIVSQIVLAKLAERAEDASEVVKQIALLANHKSVGITILGLAVIRLLWRFISKPPSLPANIPGWQRLASGFSHWSLYGLLFALPITGWLMSSAAAYSVSWFSLVTLPDMVQPSEDLKELMHEVHEVLAKLLFAIAVFHILAALKHHFIDKDRIMKRMTSVSGLIIFVLTIIATSIALGNPGKSSGSDAADKISVEERAPSVANQSDAPVWMINYDESYIRFTATQAGAPFSGEFTGWNADMRFDTSTPASGVFDVRIDLTTVGTRDQDRDATLATPEWFDSETHPEARFLTGVIAEHDGKFHANASLTIKETTKTVDFRFTVERAGTDRVLRGSAKLDRLELAVGTGDWTDTETIGQTVEVEVQVTASVAP